MGPSRPTIQIDRVSYQIGENLILGDLSLSVAEGETLVLLGESGCGKTTLLRTINRMIEPTGGEIFIEGRRSVEWGLIELRRHIGYVLQDAGLFPHFNVEQNVGLVPGLLNWDKNRIAERVSEVLELVGLPRSKFGGRLPSELSGGQRQRVGVARALAADPPIILLDEPFGALDVLTRTRLQKEFSGLVRDLGKTAIFVTHDLREAAMLASRIALMEKGRIVFLGTPAEFNSAEVPLAKAYLETIKAPA
jgi:osmoprotectant transport system ATP-binding protein